MLVELSVLFISLGPGTRWADQINILAAIEGGRAYSHGCRVVAGCLLSHTEGGWLVGLGAPHNEDGGGQGCLERREVSRDRATG